MEEKKPKPVTFCTVCNAPGYDITLANDPCDRRTSKEICLGIIQGAIGLHDWEECPTCLGTGGLPRCEQCGSAGWIFVRDRQRWARNSN